MVCVDGGEFVERFIQTDQIELLFPVNTGQREYVLQRYPLMTTSALVAPFASGVIDKQSAHCLSGCREEAPPVRPVDVISIADPQECLVYQSRWLQGVVGSFLPHVAGGKGTQLLVNEWQNIAQLGAILFRLRAFRG